LTAFLTAAATRAFQSTHGLEADGIAGRETLLRAMALGFELIEEPAANNNPGRITRHGQTSRPFPAVPDGRPVFGRFEFVSEPKPGNRENIRILGSWERDNIVAVPIPQLRAALGPGAPTTMRFHNLAAEQLKGLWADWERANILDRVLSFDGAFVARFIRGSSTILSNHAFGTAFDINAEANCMGARPPLVGQRGCVRELAPIAHKWGFYWGGHFGNRPDGMHFEVAFLR
jgi:hypothetical protein